MKVLGLLLAHAAAGQVSDPGWNSEVRHMTILAGWSAANLVGGATGLALADAPTAKAFHGSNLTWNTVNAGIVVASVATLRKRRSAPTVDSLRRRHRTLQSALLLNSALDVVYIGTGAVLWGVGGEARGIPLGPIGQSLVLQGAFLFAFDVAFLRSHRRRTRT